LIIQNIFHPVLADFDVSKLTETLSQIGSFKSFYQTTATTLSWRILAIQTRKVYIINNVGDARWWYRQRL